MEVVFTFCFFCGAALQRWPSVYLLMCGFNNRRGNRWGTQRWHFSAAVCCSPDWLHGEKRLGSTGATLECLWSSFSNAPVIFPFSPSLLPSVSLSPSCPSHFSGLRSQHISNLSLWQDKALISHKPFPPVTDSVSADSRHTLRLCTTYTHNRSRAKWQNKK